MLTPELQFVFEIKINVDAGKLLAVGETGKGLRRAIAILGDTFEGPDIKDIVLPGGYDWQLLRADGVAEIDARYVLRTDDGVLITIINKGLRHVAENIMQKLANGEEVGPNQYYFRTTPVFETGDSRFHWLTNNIFIANGIRQPAQVMIQVWKVL